MVNVLFALGALALFFFVPGYLLMKALWPEKRWRGPDATIVAIEMVTGGFLASLSLFLLVGFVLGNAGEFEAGASDPLLEGILAGFAAIFFVVGWFLGAYRREAPPAPSFVEPPAPGEEDLGPILDRFQAWSREERELRRELHHLRRSGGDPKEVERVTQELETLKAQRRAAEDERQRALAE